MRACLRCCTAPAQSMNSLLRATHCLFYLTFLIIYLPVSLHSKQITTFVSFAGALLSQPPPLFVCLDPAWICCGGLPHNIHHSTFYHSRAAAAHPQRTIFPARGSAAHCQRLCGGGGTRGKCMHEIGGLHGWVSRSKYMHSANGLKGFSI